MNDDFHAKLEQLVDHYLSLGCPCRFSRFRSVVARDTSRGCGGAFTSEEQRLLIAIFEAKVPIADRAPLAGSGVPMTPTMYQGRCARCGGVVEHSSNEFAPGGWIDYLVIQLGRRVVTNRTADHRSDLGRRS
jgi:hypothetical protein